MLELNKGHHRILYILAKAGGMVRKRTISHGTPRWNAANRDRVLADLVRVGFVEQQHTPGAGSPGAPGLYYWLSAEGLAQIETLAGREPGPPWDRLPADWRQQHAH